jgi:hypothetical protein
MFRYIFFLHKAGFSVSNAFLVMKNSPNHTRGLTLITLVYVGYLMADLGYDVWMGNARGNMYSKKHVKFTEKDDAFWRFRFRYCQTFKISS